MKQSSVPNVVQTVFIIYTRYNTTRAKDYKLPIPIIIILLYLQFWREKNCAALREKSPNQPMWQHHSHCACMDEQHCMLVVGWVL